MGSFKEINGNNFSNFRNQWKIQVNRIRKNTKDETFYMNCKFEECPVKYKSRVAFKVQKEEEKKEDPNDDQKDNEITILMKFNHNHTTEELKKCLIMELNKK